MVRYYLGTFVKKEAKIFDIPELNNSNLETCLQKIDNFTMNFSSEKELIKYLTDRGIYTKGEDKKLYIIYNYKGTKKLPVVYNSTKKYTNTEYLRYTLKTMATDITFLEKLANHYDIGKSTYNPQLANVQVLRGYVNDVRFSSDKEPFFSQVIYNALEDIFLKAVLKKVDKKTGEVDINYRGLRDLSLFIKNYFDKLLEKEISYDLHDDIRKFEYSEDYQEPDFPPNSEEEDMYLDYLEKLPDEEPDYINDEGKKL